VLLKLRSQEKHGFLLMALDSRILPFAEMDLSGPLTDNQSYSKLQLEMEMLELLGRLLTIFLSILSTAVSEETFG
jgi:hypothetical protein